MGAADVDKIRRRVQPYGFRAGQFLILVFVAAFLAFIAARLPSRLTYCSSGEAGACLQAKDPTLEGALLRFLALGVSVLCAEAWLAVRLPATLEVRLQTITAAMVALVPGQIRTRLGEDPLAICVHLALLLIPLVAAWEIAWELMVAPALRGL